MWFRRNIDGDRRSFILPVWRCRAACVHIWLIYAFSAERSPAVLQWCCLHLHIAINRWFIWPWQGVRGYIHVESQSVVYGPVCTVSEGCLNMAIHAPFCTCHNHGRSGSNPSGRQSNSSLLSGFCPHLVFYSDTIFLSRNGLNLKARNELVFSLMAAWLTPQQIPQLTPALPQSILPPRPCHSSSMLFAAILQGISRLSAWDGERRDRRPLMLQGWDFNFAGRVIA